MPQTSDGWHGFGHLDPDSEQYHAMEELISSADLEYLKARAVASRTMRQTEIPSDITCELDTSKFTWGFNNIVFDIAFSDGVHWVARIQHRPVEPEHENEEKARTLSEIATMDLVRERTTIPVPQVYDFEITPDNPFGYSYMLTQRLPGRRCDDILAKAVPSMHMTKVAQQLANVLFELSNLCFDRIGRISRRANGDKEIELVSAEADGANGPLNTSLEHFYAERDAENREIVSVTHPNDPYWLTACWILRITLGHVITGDRIRGPFPLCHLDLHHGNLLFDEEFNLTGVLDWSHAQTVPIERLAVLQEFMTFPGLSDEENRPILEFKSLVVRFLREKEASMTAAEQQTVSEDHVAYTPLSGFLESPRWEIAYFCTYSNPRRALWDAQRAAKIMYGKTISWEQLKEAYGNQPLP